MATHPAVQRKAQQELDQVLGSSDLPTTNDLQSLPYCQALLMEVLRWRPTLPLGVPHRVMIEDEYEGYRIPKGSIIVPVSYNFLGFRQVTKPVPVQNVWSVELNTYLSIRGSDRYFSRSMLHNPDDYPEPERFFPDRFMKDGRIDLDVPDPSAAFGFGRRYAHHFSINQACCSILIIACALAATLQETHCCWHLSPS